VRFSNRSHSVNISVANRSFLSKIIFEFEAVIVTVGDNVSSGEVLFVFNSELEVWSGFLSHGLGSNLVDIVIVTILKTVSMHRVVQISLHSHQIFILALKFLFQSVDLFIGSF
jgi:hypothetical protein